MCQKTSLTKSSKTEFFDAQLGMAKFKEKNNRFSQAYEIANKILANNPNMIELFVEKMKLQLMHQDWDHFYSVTLQALCVDNECLEAYRYQILKLLCKDGLYDRVSL